MSDTLPKTMRAVIYGGKGIITVEDRPVPEIREEGDVVVKSVLSALQARQCTI